MESITTAEFASLANDVYRDGHAGRCLRWNRYDYRVGQGDAAGLFCAAYLTPRSRLLVVAFRGTDDGHDLRTDARLVASGAPWPLFNSAVGCFDMWLRHLRGWVTGAAVCGHSLGGALAAMVGVARAVPAVTFNTAPLSANIRSLRAAAGVGGRFDEQVYNVRNRGDVVSGLLPLPVGHTIDLGKESQLSLAARGRWSYSDALNHSMQTLLEAVMGHPHGELK